MCWGRGTGGSGLQEEEARQLGEAWPLAIVRFSDSAIRGVMINSTLLRDVCVLKKPFAKKHKHS